MKQRIINWFLSKVVTVTIPQDVIRESKGVLYLGGQKVNDLEQRNLVSEVKALEKMRIWSILNETIKQLAYEKGWKNCRTIEELNTAKTEYHVLEVQQSIINVIRGKSD